jgi:hypothetical protein
MGYRKWLEQDIHSVYLPTIAGAKSDKALVKLCASMRDDWSRRGLKGLSAQNDCMAQVRRAIKDSLGEDHHCLEVIDLSRDEYIQLNNQRQDRVSSRNEAVLVLHDPDKIVATAVRLLESPEWAEVCAGLAVLTGRRSSELLGTAQFSLKSRWSVLFTGALKRRGESVELSFEIPTLTTADRICQALEKVRRALPQAQQMAPNTINGKFGPAVASACDKHFAGLVPSRGEGESLYTHLFRSVYATISVFWYCPPTVDPTEFKAAIQGHFQILDEKNPLQRRSLAASRHYSDFEIADEVIAKYKGKRKGIKLGVAGVQPIEAFNKGSLQDDGHTKGERLPQSSIRLFHRDKERLETIFEMLGVVDGMTQPQKVSRLLEWVEEHLDQSQESLQEEAIVDHPLPEGALPEAGQALPVQQEASPSTDFIQSHPVQLVDTHTPLEQKFDRLVNVLESFVQVQLQKQQPAMPETGSRKQERSGDRPAPPPPTRSSSSQNTERLNQVIDAIFTYNNQPDRLHDEKWAITINALKAFVKSQPKVMQVLESRKEEIEHHHLQHQINPSTHNYRHRGKHKIEEIIIV